MRVLEPFTIFCLIRQQYRIVSIPLLQAHVLNFLTKEGDRLSQENIHLKGQIHRLAEFKATL